MKAALSHSPKERPTPAARDSEALFHHILVPIDSALLTVALDQALALADATGAKVHLLHVIEPAPVMMGLDSVPIVKDPHVLAKECAAQLALVASGRSEPNRKISSVVRIGKPARLVVSVAEEIAADFVVLATHGRTGFAHFVLGSVTEHVLRDAPCPVLVVRGPNGDGTECTDRQTPRHFSRILVPVDFSDLSAGALAYAIRFAQSFGGRLTLLHVVQPGGMLGTVEGAEAQTPELLEFEVNGAKARLAALGADPAVAELLDRSVVQVGHPVDDIAGLAGEGQYDLIVCSTHGYSGVKRVFLGSTAEGLVRRAPCPLLVVGQRAIDRARPS
jgi:nucleotide-binding universal stress UspA family protein